MRSSAPFGRPPSPSVTGDGKVPALIGVVIPAHNQARFLASAIESALSQTPAPFEVIVVDDGSTDDTSAVLDQFGGRVIRLRQENQGLGAARNAGILAASATHVALLDADDEWLPNFMYEMSALISAVPDASAYYGGVKLFDAAGQDLPQRSTPHVYPREAMLNTVLRSNFLIPSTMVLDRARILEVGGFRLGFQGFEDKDLWIRLLLRGSHVVGTKEVVTRYRIHESSLSANQDAMTRSSKAVIESLFGPEVGPASSSSDVKRRAWGGHYRYQALTSILCVGDYASAAKALRRALIIDPSLVDDESLFYELALGNQPLGWRGTGERLDLPGNARALAVMLDQVLREQVDSSLEAYRSAVRRAAAEAIAEVAWGIGDRRLSRRHVREAAAYEWRERVRPLWWRRLLRTFAPGIVLDVRRALAQRFPRKATSQ